MSLTVKENLPSYSDVQRAVRAVDEVDAHNSALMRQLKDTFASRYLVVYAKKKQPYPRWAEKILDAELDQKHKLKSRPYNEWYRLITAKVPAGDTRIAVATICWYDFCATKRHKDVTTSKFWKFLKDNRGAKATSMQDLWWWLRAVGYTDTMAMSRVTLELPKRSTL